jgi:hypothetical protein
MDPAIRENAALVRGFLTDVVAGGDVAAAPVYLAEDVVTRYPVFRDGGSEIGWRVLAAADDVDVSEAPGVSEGG